MKRRNKGITLIALVITIIVLLILAGITINLTVGQNGILNRTKQAKRTTQEAEIKEEIELVILNITTDEIKNEKKLSMDLLKEELPKRMEDIIVEQDEEGQIVGTYKEYDYTITKEYEVIVESSSIRPIIHYTLSDENVGVEEVTITLTATVSEGTISKIIKPDGKEEKNVNEVTYTVTQNGNYQFSVEGSEGGKATKIVQINNLKPQTPIIEISTAYPLLTPYGIEGTRVNIIFDESEELENIYSEDGGITWNEYKGTFTTKGSSIIAMSKVKTNPSCYTQTQANIVMPSDGLEASAYDGNNSTGISYHNTSGTMSRYLAIDKEMYGKNIQFYMATTQASGSSVDYSRIYLIFYNENNEVLSETYYQGRKTHNIQLTCPENANKLEIKFWTHASQCYAYFYEVGPADQPTINAIAYYPTLTPNKVENSYSAITINYFDTSVQKLYKIENEEWKEYEGQAIRLEIGQTIYAKGIDQNGQTNSVSSFTSVMPSDALETSAYDGNNSTGIAYNNTSSTMSRYISIDKDMYGKQIEFYMATTQDSGSSVDYSRIYLIFYNENNEVLSETSYQGKKTHNIQLTCPENANKLEIKFWTHANQCYAYFYEVKPTN